MPTRLLLLLLLLPLLEMPAVSGGAAPCLKGLRHSSRRRRRPRIRRQRGDSRTACRRRPFGELLPLADSTEFSSLFGSTPASSIDV